MTKYLLILLLSLTFVVNSQADILFYDDAEDAFSTTDWYWPAHNTSYGRTITSSSEQHRAGAKSYKFVLPKPYIASVNNSHVELLLNALSSPTLIQNFPRNKEFWIGYSIFIPADFKTPYNPSNHGATMQFHSSGDACDNSVSNGPTCTFFYRPELGRWRFGIQGVVAECTAYTKDRAVAYYFNYMPGQWHDVVMNFKFDWRAYNNPFFKVWVNGEQVVNDQGINCWNDTRGPRFHIGIYAQAIEQDIIVFFDEIKIGDANSSYAEVAPSGSIVVSPDPVEITTSSLGNFVEDTTINGALSATGGTPPYAWTSADKPAWFTLNANGSWSAAPTSSGSYSFTITATDAESDTDSKVFSGSVIATAVTYPEVLTFSVDYRQTSLTVPITSFTGDENAVAYIVVQDSDTPPLSTDIGWSGTAQSTVTFATEGSHELRAYVKDTNGNVSAPAFASILIDTGYVPPTNPVSDTGPKNLYIRN